MQTLEIRTSATRKLYYLELGVYAGSGQPCLSLRPYGHEGEPLVLTYEFPGIDLRAYDADFGMRRRHAIIRVSGAFERTFDYLTEEGICTPADKILVSDGVVYGRVCRLDLTRCNPAPCDKALNDGE
jgi:hypothetical protein